MENVMTFFSLAEYVLCRNISKTSYYLCNNKKASYYLSCQIFFMNLLFLYLRPNFLCSLHADRVWHQVLSSHRTWERLPLVVLCPAHFRRPTAVRNNGLACLASGVIYNCSAHLDIYKLNGVCSRGPYRLFCSKDRVGCWPQQTCFQYDF